MIALCRAVALLTLTACLLRGQAQSNAGDLAGTVLDPSGQSISEAKVTVADADRGFSRTTRSGTEGQYRVPLLPPGRYRVRVEAAGFSPTVVDGVEIRVGDTVTLPVSLTLGALATEVSVTADTPVVEVERTQQANTVQSQQIRNLPVNRRNYLDLALLTPGVTETTTLVDGTDYRVVQAPQSGLSFGGSNGRGNVFTLDGAEHYINSGGVRPSLSQEAVAEFQVNRNSFSAELGGGFGGAVNIVSRSGTNQVHGNVFGFLRHRSLQARNTFDPGKSAFTRSQAGVTFGGPVREDRTFFFLAYERLDRQETAFVPIIQDRAVFSRLTPSQQQLVDFFRASGNAQLQGLAAAAQQRLVTTNYPATLALFDRNGGVFPYSEDNNQGSARLDHRFGENHNLYGRFNATKGLSSNAQLGALIGYSRGRSIDISDQTLMLNDTYVFSPRWVMESRLMGARNLINVITTDPNGPGIEIAGYGLFGRDIFLPFRTYEWHGQFLQTFSYFGGGHNVKFGYDVNPVRDLVQSQTFFAGRFSFGEQVPLGALLNQLAGSPDFTTGLAQTLTALGQSRLVPNLQQPITALQAYNLGLPTFYQQGFGDPNWVGWTRRFNFFLQDRWRVNSRLTLDLGVRYELEANPPSVGTDPNNIAPRVGLAWTPTADGKWVVRAGYGLFYSPNNLQIANVAETLSGSQIRQVFVPLSGAPVINPQTRQPVTSADVYQGLLSRGILGSRAIQAGDLAPYGITPAPNAPLRVEFGITDDWRNPYSQQASMEVERALGSYAVSVAYNFNRGTHLPRILDRNLLYGPRRADGQPTFRFVDPLLFQRNIFEPTANSFYHAGLVQVNKRFGRAFALNAHYTFSKAIDEVTDFNTDFQPHDQLNARAERALSSFDQRHRVVASALWQSSVASGWRGGWGVAPIFVASSARPFNVLAGVDNLGDRRVTTHRPLGAGRNIGRGPSFTSLDLRITRRIGFGDGRWNLELIGEGFNLLNRTNFRTVNNVVGNVTVNDLPRPLTGVRGVPTTPLAFTSAFDPRQFQLGMKVNF